jgi:uncharacterized protein
MAQRTSSEGPSEQYSLAKIVGIWALAAIPMGILGWIAFPLVAPDFESDPLAFGVTRVVLLTLGLVWLFVLSMIIVRQEEGNLRWATLKRRLRLNTPRDPATGEPRPRLFLWVVPFLVAVVVVEVVLRSPIENAWVSLFPFFKEPATYRFDAIFESQEILGRLVGAWWFFALFVITPCSTRSWGRCFFFGACSCPRWRVYSDAAVGWQTAYYSLFITFTSPREYWTRLSPDFCTLTLPIAIGVHGCLSFSILHRVCSLPS